MLTVPGRRGLNGSFFPLMVLKTTRVCANVWVAVAQIGRGMLVFLKDGAVASGLLLYEKQVGSFAQLMKEVRRLDSDAGVRLPGKFRGRRCLIFLTKSVGGYTVIVCAVSKGVQPIPGKRLWAEQFARTGELEAFLKDLTKGRVQAFVY